MFYLLTLLPRIETACSHMFTQSFTTSSSQTFISKKIISTSNPQPRNEDNTK